jgi:hypothetical protein
MEQRSGSLERRLFRASWHDGTLDLLVGLSALGVAGAWALDAVALGGVVPGLLVMLWWPARRAIVEPRAGYVAFSPERTARSRRSTAIGLGIGVAVLLAAVACLLLLRGGLPATWSAGLPGALFGVPVLLLGLALGLRRMVACAAIFLIAAVGVAALGLEPEIAIAAGGLASVSTGAVLLVRFLRTPTAVEAAP